MPRTPHWSDPPPWQAWLFMSLLAMIPLAAVYRLVEWLISLWSLTG